jgi:iron complex transport system ATP-binding protein
MDLMKKNDARDSEHPALLSVTDLCVRYGDFIAVDHANFTLREGQWLMLVGPNGAGKSTIANAIMQSAPYTGDITLLGRDIKSYKPSQAARLIGILAQKHSVSYSFTVDEVVRLGRYAYKSRIFSGLDEHDEAMVTKALEMTGLTDLRNHSVLQLSGGELQRTFLAQLFAQDPQILILDEPTNHLDPIYQRQVFEMVKEWLKKPGRAVISVVHDLSLAKAFGTDTLLLEHGRTVAQGAIDMTFSRENLKQTYSMDIYAWMQKLLGQWNHDIIRDTERFLSEYSDDYKKMAE